VDSFVRKNGFELFDLRRCYWNRKGGHQKGQMVFGDALYFKSPEQVLLINDITQEKIIRSICVYLVYGYVDLAQCLLNNASSKKILTNEAYKDVSKTILKFNRINLIPNFRGKGRIQGLFEKMAKSIRSSSISFGTDQTIGDQ